ncbi:MAG: hypothetical protein AAB336_03630 [Acidobacteriota bacterium]
MLAKFEKHAQFLFEHKPKELRVAVNGNFQGTLKVNSDLNEIDLAVADKEPIEFIEVYSEQQLRLLFLNFDNSFPHSKADSTHTLGFSDERFLQVNVGFIAQGAEIKLTYQDPTYKQVQAILENRKTIDDPIFPITENRNQTTSAHSIGSRFFDYFSGVTNLFSFGWRHFAVAALTIVIAFGGWLILEIQTNLSAKAILEEAEIKKLTWQFEPGKIKHWVWEETFKNSPRTADGRYVSHHWSNNLGERRETLILKYNQQGKLSWGKWGRNDGSEVLFDIDNTDRLKVFPSFDIIRHKMPSLSSDEQYVLQKHLEKEQKSAEVQKAAQSEVNWMMSNYREEKVKTHDVEGKTSISIFLKSDNPTQGGRATGMEREINFDQNTFQKSYDRLTYFLKDGGLWTEEARRISSEEATLEEFENNDLAKMLKETSVKQVSVEEFAKQLSPFYLPKKQ